MAKAPRRRAGIFVTMPTAESNVLAGNQSANLPDHDIARNAYELYEKRGREHGHDLDDWLQAERELQDALSSIAACYPREMPGLRLTLEQMQRLCGLERTICQMVLGTLVERNFLCVKADGAYARLTDGGERPRPHPAKAVLRSDRRAKKAS